MPVFDHDAAPRHRLACLMEHWRLFGAALLVLLGAYFAADAFWVSGGFIEAGLLLAAGMTSGLTLFRTETLCELFEPNGVRTGAEVVLLATIVGIFLNAPLFDSCRQHAYPVLITAVASEAAGSNQDPLLHKMLTACSVAPVYDAIDATRQFGTALADEGIASHADIDPDFWRRLLSWNADQRPDRCVAAFQAVRAKFPYIFAPYAQKLACLDRPRSRFHW